MDFTPYGVYLGETRAEEDSRVVIEAELSERF